MLQIFFEMQTTKQIYINDFGTSFYWRKENKVILDKVQLVFREMGFYFNKLEIEQFKECIKESYSVNSECADCELKSKCYKFLLKTPYSQIDLAVTMEELEKLKDLVEGTLFKIELEDYLFGEGMN